MLQWNVGLLKRDGEPRKHFKTWSPPRAEGKFDDGTPVWIEINVGEETFTHETLVTSGGELSVGTSIGSRIAAYLQERVGREVKFSAASLREVVPDWTAAKLDPSKYEYTRELLRRDTDAVRELKAIYRGRCQISGEECIEGIAGDITEAHHIVWLSRGGEDTPSNMIIVSPNYHRAIHATDGRLGWSGQKPVFTIGGRRHEVLLNEHLQPRSDLKR